jgi:hypothetical protein
MAKEKRHDNYAYDLKYQATEEQKKRRARRNRDRRRALREGKVRKGDGKDVHHDDHDGLTGIRIISASRNRSQK